MRSAALILALMLAACTGEGSATDGGTRADADAAGPDAPEAADAAPDADPTMPQTLRETGLYADFEGEVLADGVMEFRPAFELWSDGADKRRFVLLPPGETIDTSDMDFWSFPEGTRLWKEFSRDGVRVETRLLQKNGPDRDDWFMVAFAWNEAQTEAVAVPDGVADALGTDHDVPARNDCRKCHRPMPDIVLGFSALQLDHDLGGADLAGLVAAGWLSHPPEGDAPYYDVPGDDTARAALGYLHGNCGGCHHPESPVMDNVAVDLRLAVGDLGAVSDTATYRTAVGVENELSAGGATAIIEPGDPAASAVHVRMNVRGQAIAMPPVGSELVDDDGLAAVDAWIVDLGQ